MCFLVLNFGTKFPSGVRESADYLYGVLWVAGLEKLASPVRETGLFRHNGGPIEHPFKPLNMIVLRWSEGFQGVPQLGLHDGERHYSLRSLLFFQSGFIRHFRDGI